MSSISLLAKLYFSKKVSVKGWEYSYMVECSSRGLMSISCTKTNPSNHGNIKHLRITNKV